MAIKVTYSDGRTVTVDSRNKKTERDAQGRKIIRIATKKRSASEGGGKSITNYYDLARTTQRAIDRKVFSQNQMSSEAARKQQVAAAVIGSLQRSAARTAKQRATAMNNRLALLEVTPSGRRIKRVLTQGNVDAYLSNIKNAPYSEDYKAKIRAFRESLKPGSKKTVFKGKGFGTVEIQGSVIIPNSKLEKNYLSNLKKTISRDEQLKKDWAAAVKKSGLGIKKGDKTLLRAGKGVGLAGLRLLFSGKFLANASEKLISSLSGVVASSRIRKEVLKESLRAAKTVPSNVWEGVDPRKPENWINILLIATSVIAKGAALKAAKNPKVVNTQLKSVNTALSKLKSAKSRAKINPVKNKKIISRMNKQEKALLKQKAVLKKNLDALKKKEGIAKEKAKVKAGKKLLAKRRKSQAAAEKRLSKIKTIKELRKTTRKTFNDLLREKKLIAKTLKKGVRTVNQDKLNKIIRRGERAYIKNRVRETFIEDKAALKAAKSTGRVRIGGKADLKFRRSQARSEYKRLLKLAKEKGKVSKVRAKEAAVRGKATAKLKTKERELLAESPFPDQKSFLIKNKKLGEVFIQVKRLGGRRTSFKPRGEEAVQIKSANGKVTIVKTPKSTVKPLVKQSVAVVKKPTLNRLKTYNKEVLALIRIGKPLKLKASKVADLHKDFFPLFKEGRLKPSLKISDLRISKPAGAVKSLSKTKSRVVPKSRVKPKTTAIEKSLLVQAERIASRIAAKPSLKIVERLLDRLIKIRQRLKKSPRTKGLKLFTLKVKKRLTKKQRDEWDEIYSKVKANYRPSLAAILFGIYGYKPKKITGFEIRPILTKRKNANSRRKKRNKAS